MRFWLLWAMAVMAGFGLPAPAAEPAAALDRLLEQENAGRKVREAGVVDDLTYLRRVSVDLNGRIPTDAEIKEFLALSAGTRRAEWADKLLKREQFADRWTVFFGDMFRIRSGSEGGAELLALAHRAVDKGLPYDAMCRQLLSASGKAGLTPEVGFILGDGADPMAMAGVTAQVFMGVRIACAQCHNHPFDVWKRKQFYDLAAYYGKTRRVEHRIKDRLLGVSLNEMAETTILWPPEDKSQGKPRTAVKASFPFPLDEGDGPNKHIARLKELRARQEAEAKAAKKGNTVDDLFNEAESRLDPKTGKDEFDVATEAKLAAKNLNVDKDIYRASVLRTELARLVTDPRNRQFSRNLVNRVWGELLGRGFVNQLDDFREDNPPSHPRTLDYLADEFVANGYDMRWLVRTIVATRAYQRAHLPMSVDPIVRRDSQSAFVAAGVRRMISEAMFDSMVQAGHLFAIKHRPGDNMVKIKTEVREEVPDKKAVPSLTDKKPKKPVVMAGPKTQGAGYDLERSIEVEFPRRPQETRRGHRRGGHEGHVERGNRGHADADGGQDQEGRQVRHPHGRDHHRRQPAFHELDAHGLAGPGGPFPARLRSDRPQHAGRAPRPHAIDAAGADDAQRQADQRGGSGRPAGADLPAPGRRQARSGHGH